MTEQTDMLTQYEKAFVNAKVVFELIKRANNDLDTYLRCFEIDPCGSWLADAQESIKNAQNRLTDLSFYLSKIDEALPAVMEAKHKSDKDKEKPKIEQFNQIENAVPMTISVNNLTCLQRTKLKQHWASLARFEHLPGWIRDLDLVIQRPEVSAVTVTDFDDLAQAIYWAVLPAFVQDVMHYNAPDKQGWLRDIRALWGDCLLFGLKEERDLLSKLCAA